MDLFCRPFINIMILLQYVLSTKAQSISTTSLLEQRLEMLETNNHIRMNDLELEIRRLNAELNEQKACVDSLQATIGELRRSSPESHGLQIGFSASGNTSSRSLIVQFDSVKTNYGYRYSPITGKFTCSHPGLYYFSASLIKERNIPHFFGFVACHIKRNSEFLLGTVIDPTNDDTDIGTYETSAFLTVHLSRGDQVYVKCYSSLDIHSSFSGFLIQSD